MKWLTGILIVPLMAQSDLAQLPQAKNKATDYYPLKPGTKWTYHIEAPTGQKVEASSQIAKIETIDGKPMARLEATVNGNLTGTEHLTSSKEGVFRCRYNGLVVSPPLCVFRYPFKEAAEWESDNQIGDQKVKVKTVSGKIEDVTTPAGKFKASPVTTETNVNGTLIKTKLWFAPDVGIVKQDLEIGDKKVHIELVKFEGGKAD